MTEEPQLFGREVAHAQLSRLRFELADRRARVDAADFHATELELKIIALEQQIQEDEDHE